ncbi:hypothetical protein AYO37_00790 [Opitutia bacterium SCGC AG-212-L18]|nr:hypothetical protein AYO37_00790 [Opitutae bacterium SCGC AG-212-L18]
MIIQNNTINYNYKNMNKTETRKTTNNPTIRNVHILVQQRNAQLSKAQQLAKRANRLEQNQKTLEQRKAEVALKTNYNALCKGFNGLLEKYKEEVKKVFPDNAVHVDLNLKLTSEQAKQLKDFDGQAKEYIQAFQVYKSQFNLVLNDSDKAEKVCLKMSQQVEDLKELVTNCSGIVEQILSSEDAERELALLNEEEMNNLETSLGALSLSVVGDDTTEVDQEDNVEDLLNGLKSEDEEELDCELNELEEQSLEEQSSSQDYDNAAEAAEAELLSACQQGNGTNVNDVKDVDEEEIEKLLESLEPKELEINEGGNQEKVENAPAPATPESATPAAATWGSTIYSYTVGPVVGLASSWYYKA